MQTLRTDGLALNSVSMIHPALFRGFPNTTADDKILLLAIRQILFVITLMIPITMLDVLLCSMAFI